jgi:hypothetical protein
MPEFLEEQTEWLRVKPDVRLYPNSQFGVGVFSYFMLADEIEIETCRFNRDGSPGRILRVHISGSGSLFRVSVGKRGRRSGTRVRLYLSHSTYPERGVRRKTPISCLATLDKVLHVAEYRTTCSESGQRVRLWRPGELSDAWSRNAMRLNDDLWITTDRHGLFLVDGIAVQAERSHLIVNLRREQRPRLSVDRTRIMAWDRHWIGEVLRDQWSKLVDWLPDFTTLWWLDSVYPDVAARVSDALLQRRASLRQPRGKAAVRLDEVGCCAGDAELLEWARRAEPWEEHERSSEMRTLLEEVSFSSEDRLAFAAQRLELWTRIGAQIDAGALQEIGEYLEGRAVRPATVAPCIPRAGDWFVLCQVSRNPAALIACANSLGEPLQQTAERLLQYAPFLGDVLTFVAEAAAFIPRPEDVIFLSHNANGEAPWMEGTPNLIHLLKVARVLDRSAESVLAQYPRYAVFGIQAPTFSREELEAALPKDDADQLLLSGDTWESPVAEISFTLLVQTAAKTGRSLASLLDRLRAFEKVGVTSEPIDFIPTADYQPQEMDVRDLVYIRSVSNGIGLGPLLAAFVGGVPHLLGTARRLGLLPATCSDEVIAGLAIDEIDTRVLSRDGDGRPPWIGRKVPRYHIGNVAGTENLDEQDLVRRVQRLAPLGVELLEEGELQVLTRP